MVALSFHFDPQRIVHQLAFLASFPSVSTTAAAERWVEYLVANGFVSRSAGEFGIHAASSSSARFSDPLSRLRLNAFKPGGAAVSNTTITKQTHTQRERERERDPCIGADVPELQRTLASLITADRPSTALRSWLLPSLFWRVSSNKKEQRTERDPWLGFKARFLGRTPFLCS